ncbi:MAG: hypothetical protein V4692_01645 [Bdellovibrionota bacterium]
MNSKFFSFAATVFALALSSPALAQHDHHAPPKEAPSVHGMLVFGTSKIYVSHLPMFHAPHDYQLIFEVELDARGNAQYQQAKKLSSETVYTIEPEQFVLSEMIANPKPFKAKIYSGHFERGGTVLAHVTIHPKKTVFSKKFDPAELKPQEEKYFVIENESEKFSVHVITAKPDFDEISEIKKDGTKSVLYFETGDLSH